MNDQQLTQALQDMAAKDIRNVDKREAIRKRILARQTQPIYHARWTVVTAVLMLALISATVVAALYQTATDPGLTAVEDAGLVQPLNVNAASDGFTFEITKGYADANRVALWYVITGPNLDTGFYVNSTLFKAGQPDELFGTGGQSSSSEAGPKPNSLAGVLTFDHTYPPPEDGEFHLRLRLQLYKIPANMTGDYTMQDNVQASADLEFTLPAIGALELFPKLETTTHDVTFSLNSLRITPSQTALNLCFDMPSAQDWQVSITASIGDQQGLLASMGTSNGKTFRLTDPHRCMDINFLLPYQEENQQMVIEIDHLETSISEGNEAVLERAKERLTAQGIEIEFHLVDHGLNWTIRSQPEGLTEADLNQLILDSMRERYDGPWRFVVGLP